MTAVRQLPDAVAGPIEPAGVRRRHLAVGRVAGRVALRAPDADPLGAAPGAGAASRAAGLVAAIAVRAESAGAIPRASAVLPGAQLRSARDEAGTAACPSAGGPACPSAGGPACPSAGDPTRASAGGPACASAGGPACASADALGVIRSAHVHLGTGVPRSAGPAVHGLGWIAAPRARRRQDDQEYRDDKAARRPVARRLSATRVLRRSIPVSPQKPYCSRRSQSAKISG